MTDNSGIALLAVTQSVTAFTTFLPKITDVRKGSVGDTEFASDVRTAETAAVVVTMAVSSLAASLAKSSTPVVVGAVMCIVLIVLYESTLRRSTPDTTKVVIRDA